jgi:hypothetical protein
MTIIYGVGGGIVLLTLLLLWRSTRSGVSVCGYTCSCVCGGQGLHIHNYVGPRAHIIHKPTSRIDYYQIPQAGHGRCDAEKAVPRRLHRVGDVI